MLRWSAHVLMGIFLLGLFSCNQPPANLQPFQPQVEKDYGRALPPGALALRKIGPERYPDFSKGYANLAGLEQAIQHSLSYLSKPSSQKYFPYGEITHAQAVASLNHFLDILHSVRSGAELDAAIRRDFDVYESVGCDDKGTVFFTGYYTPIFEGRRQQDARFRYPLYGAPPDLVKDSEGRTLGRRTPDGRTVPYYTRREIVEGGLLDGTEVAWLKDPFEAYVVTVQGSAKLRLADGSLYELGYSGNNGHEYTPVSRQMIKDKVIGRKDLSLQTLLRYFAAHPDKVNYYCLLNDRLVFFKERSGGPFGCLNVPVTPYRTIATDKEVFPRACLAFLTTSLPTSYNNSVQIAPYSGFALDQDAGGAIRAAGRSDVYMGIGPTAEATAGRTGAEGALYYIFLKQGSSGQQQ
jgi:membrane-bound lytic murein transglycosylase A